MCVRQTEREHSRVPVTADYNVSDLQVSVADPGCFDSEKYLSIWDMCLISECWGPGRCEIQINWTAERSVELQDASRCILGARQELKPDDYKSLYSQNLNKMRLKQKIRGF